MLQDDLNNVKTLVETWDRGLFGGKRKHVHVKLSQPLVHELKQLGDRLGIRTYEILNHALCAWRKDPELFERAYLSGQGIVWEEGHTVLLSSPEGWHKEIKQWAQDNDYSVSEGYQIVLSVWCWMLKEFGELGGVVGSE